MLVEGVSRDGKKAQQLPEGWNLESILLIYAPPKIDLINLQPILSSTPMDWKHLTRISDGARLVVERVRLPDTGIVVEGSFDLPPLAQLSIDDQVFVAAFVKSHGSIKEMERLFGVSYPTIKSRLNRLSTTLDSEWTVQTSAPGVDRAEILDRLERGEITAEQAAEALRS
jgi:hypothetical protein